MNDRIQVKDPLGRVMELNLRTTRIKTYDGKDIYVPNALVLKKRVTNFTRDGYIRQDFLIGIDYDANAQAVIDTLSGAGEAGAAGVAAGPARALRRD